MGLPGIYDPAGPIFPPLQPRFRQGKTARTAGRSGRAGEVTHPALSPAFLFVLRRAIGRGGSAHSKLRKQRPKPGPYLPKGAGTLPRSEGGHTVAYTAKQGENAQGGTTAERKFVVLCIAYQELTCIAQSSGSLFSAAEMNESRARGPPDAGYAVSACIKSPRFLRRK